MCARPVISSPTPGTLSLDGCVVDLERRVARWEDREEGLTRTEARLLGCLAGARGEVVAREVLLREAFGYRPGVQSRTLDTTMRRLRKKVEVDPAAPRHLLTEVGVGYRLALQLGKAAPSAALLDLDPFVGREPELARLDHLAAVGARLVTLTGPGGIGKTRLASRWISARGGLVVELAALRRPADLPLAMAAALEFTGTPTPERVGAELVRREKSWVLLDNLEQLLPDAGPLAAAVAATAPGVSFLITSRERLGVPGETVVELGPLPDAVAVDLLQLRAPGAFEGATPEELDQIARRLCGMPLALELAASRVGLLGVAGLLEQLDRSLAVLAQPGESGRQASMRETVDWSWSLLTPGQRVALARLSVFRGGATLAAALEVLGADGAAMLEALRAKSWLVTRTEPHGQRRFDMLEPLRELVVAEGPDPGDAADRHAVYFSRLGEEVRAAITRSGIGRARVELAADLWNLLAAADHSLARGRADDAAGSLLAAYEEARWRLPADEVEARLAALLEHPRLSPRTAPWVALAVANLRRRLGPPSAAFAVAGRGRALARQVKDPITEIAAVQTIGILYHDRGDYEAAEDRYREALALAREAGASNFEATLHGNLGGLLVILGRLAEARTHHEAAVALHASLGNVNLEAWSWGILGMLWTTEGAPEQAERCYERAIEGHRRSGNRKSEGTVLGNWSSLALMQGDPEASLALSERAVEIHVALGGDRDESYAQANRAEALRRLGRLDEAQAAVARGQAISPESRFPLVYRVLETIGGEIDPDLERGHSRIAAAEAALRESGVPIEAAVATCRRGRVALRRGARQEALEALEQATASMSALGLKARSELGDQVALLAEALAR